MKTLTIVIIYLCLLTCHYASGKRVLIVSSQITSHFLESAAVSEELVKRGHEVYALISTRFSKGNRVIAPGVKPLHFETGEDVASIDEMLARSVEIDEPVRVSEALTPFCRAALQDGRIRKQIDDLKFDLALVDGFLFNYCSFLLPYVHGIPYAMMFSTLHPWTTGSPALPSFYPIGHYQGRLNFNDQMTFAERLENLYWFVQTYAFVKYPGRLDLSLLEEYAPEVSSWDELVHKSVLFIQTRDHMLDWPCPLLPNFITTPGVTIRAARPLPDNIERILKASDGAIFVSFGSISSRFPTKILDSLTEVFNQFPITVVWAISEESVEYVKAKVRPNVYVLPWVPQNDILGHKKTKVFVTHCGNNGQYEALYHGVPMVGVPIFGEQPHNAFRIQDHGYGVSMNATLLSSFSPDDLVRAITEVLSNPKYSDKAQKASQILKDAPMLPAGTITSSLEHVMKHGSGHLRSRGMDLPWYKFFMFDILALVAVSLQISFLLMWVSCRYLCKVCKRRKTKEE